MRAALAAGNVPAEGCRAPARDRAHHLSIVQGSRGTLASRQAAKDQPVMSKRALLRRTQSLVASPRTKWQDDFEGVGLSTWQNKQHRYTRFSQRRKH
jgi:hypothetical protein